MTDAETPADAAEPAALSEAELIGAVRELAQGPFAERAEQADRSGIMPIENYDELRALRIPGLVVPAEFGGLDASGETYLRIIEEIARGDSSTAVALNMHLLVSMLLRALPPIPRRSAVLAAIAEGAWCCAPGSIPLRQLDRGNAGFRVAEDGAELVINGRAGFASMSDAARFILTAGQIQRDGADADLVLALVEADSEGVEILGNWDGMGLRSTASHDIAMTDVRVPRGEAMVAPPALIRAAEAMMPQQAFQLRALPALGILAIWLGTAQAVFDETVAYLRKRSGYLAVPMPAETGGAEPRSEQPWAQSSLGEMDAWLETSRELLYAAAAKIEQPFDDRQAFIRYQVRLTYQMRRMAEELAQRSISLCGAHAYVKGSPLERLYRDLTGAIVMAWKTDELRLSLGQAALGREITIVGPAGT